MKLLPTALLAFGAATAGFLIGQSKSAHRASNGRDGRSSPASQLTALTRSTVWSGTHIKAANYALQYIDDPKMKAALANLAWSWSERDRDSALAWAEENIKDPSLIDRMRLDSIQSKIWENPSQATEKLSELPEGKMRQEFRASVANNWASSHLDAAREWANGLPEGIERDLALSGVTGAWIADDTAAAREFIEGSQELDAQTRWRLLTPR